MSHVISRCALAITLLSAAAAILGRCPTARAGDVLFEISEACGEGDCCGDEEPVCSYGPCDCQPRGTLFQWSYGTTFRGGPPGFDEPLATDRPDFTEASTTVGRGVLQLEMGYTYVDDTGDGGPRTHSFPELLMRYGVFADWLELRVAWNYAEETAGATTLTGSEDLYLGLKIALMPQECLLPEMAFVPQMTVPIGGPFSAAEVLPGGNLIYSWEINDFISTAGQTQFNRAIDDGSGAPYTEFSQSWTIGYSLAERIGAYTEWFVLVPDGADTAQTEHYADGGFTFLVNNNLQLDVRAGVGLSQAADDYFLGVGASQRF